MRKLLLVIAMWSGAAWGNSSRSDLEEFFSSDLEYRHCRIALEDDSRLGLVVRVRDNDYDPFGPPIIDVNSSSYELLRGDGNIKLIMEKTSILRDRKFGHEYGKAERTLRLIVDEETREVKEFEFYREMKYNWLNTLYFALYDKKKLTGKDEMTSCNK